MFSTILQAKQVAEAAEALQGNADTLSLLGQAHCNATMVAIVKSGTLPFGTQGQGKYEEALAYQQQALELQEALHDTRGISESHFGIGLETRRRALVRNFRWQSDDRAGASRA